VEANGFCDDLRAYAGIVRGQDPPALRRSLGLVTQIKRATTGDPEILEALTSIEASFTRYFGLRDAEGMTLNGQIERLRVLLWRFVESPDEPPDAA
jgi:hypothetical protein